MEKFEELSQRQINNFRALDKEWSTLPMGPKYKECAKSMWTKEFFEYCESMIAKIRQVDALERKHHRGDWTYNISEIVIPEDD